MAPPVATAPSVASQTVTVDTVEPSPSGEPNAQTVTPKRSEGEARSAAEKVLPKLKALFADLSLGPAEAGVAGYRFEVSGRAPGHPSSNAFGSLLVDGEGKVVFQEIGGDDVFALDAAVRREREKRGALARVYAISEVKAFCKQNAPRCVHLIEDSPQEGCVPDANDPCKCGWGISIRTVQGGGTHLSKFADFCVQTGNRARILVAPIETGEFVDVSTWRCLHRNDWEPTRCPNQ